MQLVQVQVEGLERRAEEDAQEKGKIAEGMAAKAAAYAQAIAGYLAALFGAPGEGGPDLLNKFQDIKPSIVIHDVRVDTIFDRLGYS
jgi:hypothetical protein